MGDVAKLKRGQTLPPEERTEQGPTIKCRRRILDVGGKIKDQVGALRHLRRVFLANGRQRHQQHKTEKGAAAEENDQGHERAKERGEETLHDRSS